MKIIVVITTILIPIASFASWSEFAYVTPESQAKYEISVCIAALPDKSDSIQVVIPRIGGESKVAWLIKTKHSVDKQFQEFRKYLWALEPYDPYIESVERIQSEEGESKVDLFLGRDEISRSYIYVDFPDLTLDGGYYFSVDLGTFLGFEADEC